MLRKLTLVLLVFVAKTTFAQQEAEFTHYGFNSLYLNPAYAGFQNAPNFRTLYRERWLGYKSDFDPKVGFKSQVFTADIPLIDIDGGIGIGFINDRQFTQRQTGIRLNFSKHFKLGDGKLGIGFNGDFNSLTLGLIEYRPPTHPAEIDDAIPDGRMNDYYMDFGSGLWYQTSQYYVGLSMSRILQNNYQIVNANGIHNSLDRGGAKRHMYLTAGYHFDLDYNVRLTPTLLYKADFGKAQKTANQFELGGRVEYDKRHWGGLNFRQGESIGLLLGTSFMERNALKFGYAIDFTVAGNRAKAGTSHELMLAYYLPEVQKMYKPPIKTPRYNF